VANAWRDHYCYAMTSEEATPEGLVRRLVAGGHAQLP
jgi:ribosomal-protein-alanine N-acetyltransferase